MPMVTVKVAPDRCLALAQAASQHASAAHGLSHVTLWLAVTGLAAASVVAYRVSLWLHPFTLCRRCAGTGITSGFFPWSRAFCRKCGGRGLVPRLGTIAAGPWGRYPR
jgi:ribosomal protein L40E